MTTVNFGNSLNMLFGNSYGSMLTGSFGSFGGFGMGTSLFTNCFGEVNYDAMAGLGVANAIFSVAGQAISSSKAEKQSKKASYENYQNEIATIDAKLEKLKSLDPADEIDASYDKNITTAETNLASAKTALDDANELLASYNKDLEKEGITEGEKTEIQQKIDKQKEIIEEKQKEYDKLNGDKNKVGSVKYYKAEKQKAIDAQQTKIDEQIKELEDRKAQLEKAVENIDLDNADGSKLTRTSDKNYEAKLVDGKVDKSKDYGEKDIRTAINHFINAIDGTPEKLQKAQNVYDMYNCVPESDKNSTMKKAVEIAYNYIQNHKTEE